MRWDNAIELSPLFVRPLDGILDFRYFDLSNTFMAGNEYRSFDFSSFQVNTFNVQSKKIGSDINTIFLYRDFLKAGVSYDATIVDANGRYGAYHEETGKGEVEADYAWVEFFPRSQKNLYTATYISSVTSPTTKHSTSTSSPTYQKSRFTKGKSCSSKATTTTYTPYAKTKPGT